MTTRATRDADLSFSSGRVVCQCSVSQPGSEIDLTMKLYRNGRVIKTCSDTSMNYVFLSDSYPATSGSTYQLAFTCYVDGTGHLISPRDTQTRVYDNNTYQLQQGIQEYLNIVW